MANMADYLLGVNKFGTPKKITDNEVIYTLLVRIILLEPGTFQDHPDMGVGIVSRYRYSFTSDLHKLQKDISEQISKYLPELVMNEINLSEGEKLVYINITVNNMLFSISFDKNTYAVSDVI